MSILKSIARKHIYPKIISLGLEKIPLNFGGQLVVLAYHGIVKNKKPILSERHLDQEEFERHLKYIRNNYDVISLDQAFTYYQQKIKPSKKSIVITFDDGYKNNFKYAVPLLEKYNMPATFYITTKRIQDENFLFWFDLLDISLENINDDQLSKLNDNELVRSFGKKLMNIGDIKSIVKTFNKEQKEAFLSLVYELLDTYNLIKQYNSDYYDLMNEEELKYISASSLFTLGSHSHSHHNMDILSKEQLIFELKESKKLLEEVTQKEILSIAYPDGAYNDFVKKTSIECGFKQLLAVNSRAKSDKYDQSLMTRHCISNTTTWQANMIQISRAFIDRCVV